MYLGHRDQGMSEGIEQVRKTLLWLVEQQVDPHLPAKLDCGRCGHSQDDHRLDDGSNVRPTDLDAEFRCTYPMARDRSPAAMLCDCPDYVDMHDV